MLKNACFILFLAVFGFAAGCGVALAQEPTAEGTVTAEAIVEEESVTVEDLGVSDPGLLPSSPFYFFKNWGRGVRMFFTFNSVSKAELELKYANDKAAELKALVEREPERVQALGRAAENYRVSQERLKARIEGLRETSENPNVDRLLENLAARTVKHDKLFAELKAKFEDDPEKQDIYIKIEGIDSEAEDTLVSAAEKDTPEKFAQKLEKALVDLKGTEFKHFHSLEALDRIHAKAADELRNELDRIRRDFSKRFEEDLEGFVEEHGDEAPELVEDAFRRLHGDESRRLAILEEIRQRAGAKVKEVIDQAREVLDKELKGRADLKARAEEAIRHAEERIAKLNARMGEVANVPQSVRSLHREATSNLERSRKAFAQDDFGEAFGQAHSAEALARNALRILEESRPGGDDLEKDFLRYEELLRAWEEKFTGLAEEIRAKAEEIWENVKEHLELARESYEKRDLAGAKKHLEAAKAEMRRLERFFNELFRRHEGPTSAVPSTTEPLKPTACPDIQIFACTENETSLECVRQAKELAAKYPRCGYERYFEIVKPPVTMCTREYAPVCGVNGKTYPNACNAKVAGVEVEYSGECEKPLAVCTQEYAPVCGADGKTYSNACHAKVAGVEVKYSGECGRTSEPTASTEPSGTVVVAPPSQVTVAVDELGNFSPREVKVRLGGTVTWVNKSSRSVWPASAFHPTHEVYPGSGLKLCGTQTLVAIFDACRGLGQGETYSFKFDRAGTWKYHDHFNPLSTGAVTVEFWPEPN